MISRRNFIRNSIAALAVGVVSPFDAIAIQPSVFRGTERFHRIVKIAGDKNWDKLPIGELMGKLATELVGTPYEAGTLELSADQEICSVNLEALDCVTFVETTLALARMLKKGRRTEADLLTELQLIRYRGGMIGDYSTRLHYTSDWMVDNEAKHIVKLLSQLPGAQDFSQKVSFMTSNQKYYKQLLAHPELIEKMKTQEATINRRSLVFIPINKIASAEPLLKTGDIVGICTNMPGLDITHTGLVVRDTQGTAHFMDASSRKAVMKVVLEPGSISEKLIQSQKQSPNLTGAMFARPLEPAHS